MSDVSNLILNRIRESVDRLSKEGVGRTELEDCQGIQYQVDGRYFYISVKELGVKE